MPPASVIHSISASLLAAPSWLQIHAGSIGAHAGITARPTGHFCAFKTNGMDAVPAKKEIYIYSKMHNFHVSGHGGTSTPVNQPI
ncbi:exported hypothetical protein [Paraburkholderia piptadeniae]|uniref:Uncharacterized protein n=1 Tax=Paraburkholderia piptadeniae TaxID=1701573 RepID=A0A1N7SUF5_9BURK|nr:exported hypothetical protein [Paraburkholderia piptadeniae]